MKEPECPICGGKHYKFQCWRNPARKMPLRRSESASKPILGSKAIVSAKSTQKSRKTLVRELDMAFSKLVRLKYANSRGYVRCYTCGKLGHWKSMDCGHFHKRGHIHTRWDLANCRPQCMACNRTLGGNYEIYTRKMKKELTPEQYKTLEIKAHDTSKVSTLELEYLLREIEQKLRQEIQKRS